jgi:acyl CoA:acetate/3-ketoacid CoA transferase alpha subunit
MKKLYQTFCYGCRKPVGRVRRFHDSAMEESDKHTARTGHGDTIVVGACDRGDLHYEMRMAAAGIPSREEWRRLP